MMDEGVFDVKTALLLAKLSEAAYLEEDRSRAACHALGFEDFCQASSSDSSTHAIVCADEKECIVAFRGTRPSVLADWITDFDAMPTMLTGRGYVHSGFLHAYDSISASLEDAISSAGGIGARRVWFTGHSMGAALATLGVLHCGDRSRLYTIGSPRVGDGQMCAKVRELTGGCSYRIVNGCDIVTRVPLEHFAYRHVESVVYLLNDEIMLGESARHLWERFVVGVEASVDMLRGKLDDVEDHLSNSYVTNIQKVLSKI